MNTHTIRRNLFTGAIATALALIASHSELRAQGCVLIRTNAPIFGADDTLPQQAGDWQLSLSYRGLTADDHYSGTQFQYARKANNTYVINTQQQYDLTATYFINDRWSASIGLPVVNASWSIPTPFSNTNPGPRAEQNASGFGDLIVGARFWTLDPVRHPHGNFSVGLGVKAPTGDYKAEDSYPNLLTGANDTEKVVDQSIQSGDGGWGYVFDLQGYRSFRRATFYGSGTYLANPKDTNGAESIVVGLGFGNNPAVQDLAENSVVDNYLLRAGAVFPVASTHLGLSLGFRMEGLPRYDLIGDSHGFRRPGYETFLEPGILYTVGRSTMSLYVPIGLVQNRLPNPYTGNPGDATFPEYIIVAGFSYQFSGASMAKTPALPPSESPLQR